MIDKIEVRSALGQMMTLELDNTDDGIIIEDIDGLDPVNATLVSSSFAGLDGAQYQSSRREARNIILTLGLDPDYITTSVRQLRQQLYQFFMPKSKVDLRFFMVDGLIVDISGRVETCTSPLFVQEPTVVISMMCFETDFVKTTSEEVEGDTVSDTTETLIEYEGSVPVGIRFTLNVDRELDEFTIYHRGGDDIIRTLEFAGDLEADDILVINMVPRNKYVQLTRDSMTTSVLYGVSPQSSWIELLPGDNYIRVYATGDPVPFTIEFVPRYGGL